ncbi:MAG: hypothetical protein MJB57_06220 [Gemmatimonadetes bacterium]|nr:hypothetical protein [Gemmatimonadota bacterium]
MALQGDEALSDPDPEGGEPDPGLERGDPEPGREAPDPDLTDDEAQDEPTSTRAWWLRLQIALGLSGGAVWFAGARWEQEFLAGAGAGLIAAALILRVGRAAADG